MDKTRAIGPKWLVNFTRPLVSGPQMVSKRKDLMKMSKVIFHIKQNFLI